MTDLPEHIMDEAAALRRAVVWQSNEAVEHIARALAAAEQRGREEAIQRFSDWFDAFVNGPAKTADFDDLAAAIRRGEP